MIISTFCILKRKETLKSSHYVCIFWQYIESTLPSLFWKPGHRFPVHQEVFIKSHASFQFQGMELGQKLHGIWSKDLSLFYILEIESRDERERNQWLPIFPVRKNHLGILLKLVSDSVGLEEGTRFCICKKFPGDADVAFHVAKI